MVPRGDVGVETLPPDDPVGTVAPAVRLPAIEWDRYEVLELLGKGGMGEVYKARDRRIDRAVAIKFIRGADPNLTMRFLREARAQARIDHPNICPVYEVGEVEGRAYIVIKLIAGEPLHKAVAQMSLDEKVAVMRDVAAAIQEAHRLGIVHRDLKPSNIMLERVADGRWFPVVMDFGLAHEATVEVGITESRALLGTPAYMSPEQARGDVHSVDRRSDIYGLGATLYELLTGRPPFPTTSLALALTQAINDAPPAPRRLVPSLPVDLETIALKCLAKDPTQRYPSATALADDLGRYLDGEPILGHRQSLWQRVRLSARRHRALFVLGTWSLAIIVAVASLGVRAWITSRAERARTVERARLAEQLGRDAKYAELFLHSAYQLPLHDVRPERELIRARMRSISAMPHDLGELGDAIVHDALGRGHLALYRWREAADELALAVAGGLDTPELHAARGRALGELYHRALADAHHSGDKAWLAVRRRDLAQQYLTPALAELEASRASGDSAELLEALIALYRRDFAAAEQLARAAGEHAPWLFEAHRIAADAAYGAAVEKFDRGDYDAALHGLEHASTLYAQASDIARSDASIYEAAAQTWLQRAEIDFRQSRRSPREPLERALAAVDHALAADPDDAQAYTTKAYALTRWYQTPALSDHEDQRALLERIAQTAERAVAIDPRDASAWDALGNAHISRGSYEAYHGGQGAPWWNLALGEIGKALAIEPNDPWANNDVGVAHRWLGTSLDHVGRDPMPEYQAALRSCERAAEIDPQYLYACYNQADIQAAIAEHEAASERDPRPAVDAVRRLGEHCLEIDPTFYSVLDTLAQGQLTLAQYLVEHGGDPSEALGRARGYLDRADKVHPGNMVTWYYRAGAAIAAAQAQLRDHGDPTSEIAAGREALREALRLSPSSVFCHVEAARLDLVEAAWAAQDGRGSAPALARALAGAEHAVALDDQFIEAKLVAAEACLKIATAERSAAVVERGLSYVDQALKQNPHHLRAQTLRTRLLQLRAR